MGKKKKIEYYDLDKDAYLKDDYYDSLAAKRNPLQSLVHQKRYLFTNTLVQKYYQPGRVIVDFACGNCSWNQDKLPVIGVDYSRRMLNYALEKGRINQALCENVNKKTTLKANSVDILVITETIEHFPKLSGVMKEMNRVLKRGGKLIISVPYDTFFSLWRPLFLFLCFYQGRILGKELYKRRCGHVQQFSPSSLRELLEEYGFLVKNQLDIFRFILFMVVEKQ